MTAKTYTTVSLKALQALFKETNYSGQNQAIVIAVLVHETSVVALAEKYGVTRAAIYKTVKKVSESLNERNLGDSSAWIKATHHLPLNISREFTQWEQSVQALSDAQALKAIDALQRAIFKCRGQLLVK
jgi:transposase-like protein